MRSAHPYIVATISLLLASCAGLRIDNVSTDAADVEATGFRYYETAPFLLVYTDNKGGLTSTVKYLPDMTLKRAVTPYNYLASNNTTLTFDNGRLQQSKAEVDETVIPSAIVSGLEKIATSAINAALLMQSKAATPKSVPTIPPPMLFRIVHTKDGWSLAGGQALDPSGKPVRIRYAPLP
jgi:hypothetical protein